MKTISDKPTLEQTFEVIEVVLRTPTINVKNKICGYGI
jgi:hypothetical protein